MPIIELTQHLRTRSAARLPLGLAFLLLAATAMANGVISGKVLQADGEPFGFADVMLEPEEGYVHSESALTEEDGTFRFPAVPVGNYKLTAFADGFKPQATFKAIGVTQGSAQTFTITLVPLAVETAVVVVTANTLDLLDIKKTDTSMTISGDFVSKIPLQNKRLQDIVFLFPGVTRTGSSDSTDISIGGGTSGQIGFRLNGMNINDPVNGGPVLDMPTAAIESFRLITGGFNAEHGEQSSGIADIITKSGRNEIDFSFGLDFRDTAFGAQGIEGLDEAAKNIDELLRAEGTLLESELAAGFRLLGVDPLSTLDDDNNPTPRRRVRKTISTGGPIVRDKVFFHTTLESLADDYGNAYAEGWNQNDQVTFVSKLKWNVFQGEGTSNTLEFTLNADSADDAGWAGLTASRSVNILTSASAWTAGISDIHIFNDTTVLESKLNFTHTTTALRPEDVRTGVGTQYRIFMPPGGFISYAVGAATVSFDETINAIRGDSTLTKAFDKHNVKGGLSYQFQTFKSFQENGDAVNDLRVVNDRSVFNVNRRVGTVTLRGPSTRTDDASWQAGVFLQDSWQVTDNFVLDLGVRGDYQSFVGDLFLAPRLGFSLDPIGDAKTRFYGNWGLFYDNIFAAALEFAQTPDTFFGALFFTPQFIAAGGARFSSVPIDDIYKAALATQINSSDPDAVAYIIPTIHDRYRLDEGISAPRNNSWSLGIERRLPGNTRVQLGYSHIQRTHQLRTRTEIVRVATDPGQTDVRDVIYESTGEGSYEQFAFEFQRPFSDKWEMNLSYTQSKNIGPIAPPQNPVDPNDVYFVDGSLGNDRTHVAKLQAHALVGKKAKLDISGDFTWQTGTPVSARIVTSNGNVFYPLGRNTQRLPSSRQLNLGMQRVFRTADKAYNITGRLQFYNLLNDLNVFGGIVTFASPQGRVDPESFPPLRPEILITDVDVSRSMEIGITIGF